MAVYNLPNYTNDQGFGLPLNIRRGNPNPLDNSAVWASLDAAKNYAKNDPTAYVGQIISVVDNANSVVDVYKINDTAGNLVLVGTVTLGDDQSIVKNDDDTLSLYDFGKKYYKFVAATEDVAAHYEAVEGWKDGLEPKVSNGVLAWYEPNPTTVDGLQSSINNLQAEVDNNKKDIKANADAIAILNGDSTKEGSVAYQIAAVIADADEDFDTLKEIADWIAAHPTDAAEYNKRITDNEEAIDDLKKQVGEGTVDDRIAGAIDGLNITDYAKASDLQEAVNAIGANADDIGDLKDQVGEGTVDERINAAVKETVDGVEQDKFALRVHGHTVADVNGLGATLDTLAAKDTVNGIDLRVQAIENGLDTAIDTAIQTHVATADATYETIANVAQLSDNIGLKIAALEKADTDNLEAANTYAETKIAELNITQYAKQADLDTATQAINNIKDHATIDSFAGVMAEVANKQDIIPDNTYDAHGAAKDVKDQLDAYKLEANGRLEALEAIDNATQAEMDAAVDTLEQADAAILGKIGDVAEGQTVVGLIGAAQTAAGTAQGKADDAYRLASTKATMDDVNTAIANAGHAVAADVNTAIDGINNKIGTVADDKTVVEMIADAQAAATYDDKDVRALIGKNAEGIAQEIKDREDLKTELEGKIDAKVAQSAYDTKVGALVDEDKRLAGLISDNATAISGLNTTVGTLVGEDKDKSIRTIANEELAAQLIAENAAEALDTLQEIAAWIQKHPGDAATMNAAIETLQGKVDTGDQTVSAYVTAAINALNIGDYATVVALGTAISDEVSRADAAYATKTELQGVSDVLDQYKTAHKDDYNNNAIDAKVKGVQDQIDTLGDTYATDAELTTAISDEVTRADAAYAAKSTFDTHVGSEDIHVTTADKEKWNAAEQNAKYYSDENLQAAKDYADEAVSDKADKATTLAGYGITDAMTADDIIAMFTWQDF